jgi:hypothetical protein
VGSGLLYWYVLGALTCYGLLRKGAKPTGPWPSVFWGHCLGTSSRQTAMPGAVSIYIVWGCYGSAAGHAGSKVRLCAVCGHVWISVSLRYMHKSVDRTASAEEQQMGCWIMGQQR